jgi:hypothetical protein
MRTSDTLVSLIWFEGWLIPTGILCDYGVYLAIVVLCKAVLCKVVYRSKHDDFWWGGTTSSSRLLRMIHAAGLTALAQFRISEVRTRILPQPWLRNSFGMQGRNYYGRWGSDEVHT